MAFENNEGELISFDCSELIGKLKADISEFGGEMFVEVITEERRGVVIYKDYNFVNDKDTVLKVPEKEKIQKMTASALLLLYEQQNSIL